METVCRFCSEAFDPGYDTNAKGFWCDWCEGYTFFDTADEQSRNFNLILEGKSDANVLPMASRRPVKLKKQLSPLRYPGGKGKIADYLLQFVQPQKTGLLISPYVGGGSVEFAYLEAGVFKQLVINDADFGVFSLFELIRTFPDALTSEIRSRSPNLDDFLRAREIIKNHYDRCDLLDAAWSLLIVNRLAYSGIYKANPLGGIQGNPDKMLSRWNPDALCKRIAVLHSMRDRFQVFNLDAMQFIEDNYWNDRSTYIIDPPYFYQGKQLYLHYYNEEDHASLQELTESLYREFPCADFLVTYDDAPFIESLYSYPVIRRIQRYFSA